MKILNIKNQISNIPKGFTLIELLAAIIVLIAVGTVIGAILFSTFRGTNKTNTLTSVRQNGYFAIAQVSKMLRGATRLDYPYPCLTPQPSYSSITFTSADGGQTKFECSGSTIASNNASLLDTSAVTLDSCYFTCTQDRATELPAIGINLFLRQKTITSLTDFTASATAIPFQTSIILRNINR